MESVSNVEDFIYLDQEVIHPSFDECTLQMKEVLLIQIDLVLK